MCTRSVSLSTSIVFAASAPIAKTPAASAWGIPVDQQTYENNQSLPACRIADKALSSLVEINPARSSAGDFAKIRPEGERCPALHKDLCAIQQTLGESYLPDLCSKYPRVLNASGPNKSVTLLQLAM